MSQLKMGQIIIWWPLSKEEMCVYEFVCLSVCECQCVYVWMHTVVSLLLLLA